MPRPQLYVHYGCDHGGEPCRRFTGACLRYERMDHYICDYPLLREAPESSVGSTRTLNFRSPISMSPQRQRPLSALPVVATHRMRPPTPQRRRLVGRSIKRVHSTTMHIMKSRELIESTLLLENYFVKIPFDTGATHSFISKELAK